MKILHIAQASFPTIGGVETYVADVSKALTRRGHSVQCLAVDHGSDESDILAEPRKMISAVRFSRTRRKAVTIALDRIIRSFQPNVIHCHNPAHLGIPFF
jgi:glycosyltransferase involved in cell wall biosynthesis